MVIGVLLSLSVILQLFTTRLYEERPVTSEQKFVFRITQINHHIFLKDFFLGKKEKIHHNNENIYV